MLQDRAAARHPRVFADPGVPLWIVAADLVLQREFVFDRGDLAAALDATSAIPTIFPVVPALVVNPLPQRTMANLALTDVCVQPALGAILDAGEAAAEVALPGIRAAFHLGAPTG